MRKSQTRKIDAVIRDFLNEANLDKKLKEVHIVSELSFAYSSINQITK